MKGVKYCSDYRILWMEKMGVILRVKSASLGGRGKKA